jgi:hypothetical protein
MWQRSASLGIMEKPRHIALGWSVGLVGRRRCSVLLAEIVVNHAFLEQFHHFEKK